MDEEHETNTNQWFLESRDTSQSSFHLSIKRLSTLRLGIGKAFHATDIVPPFYFKLCISFTADPNSLPSD